MLFSEVYGSYFAAVGAMITEELRGRLTTKRMREIITEKCFGESVENIERAFREDNWPLLEWIENEPSTPVTTLEKRWLKALISDRRIRLFDISEDGLEDVEPLFTPDMFEEYDRYADGDPYEDERYIENFRLLRTALREKRRVRVAFTGYKGKDFVWNCVPRYLEYSEKDDKFRLVTAGEKYDSTINLARMTSVTLLDEFSSELLGCSARHEDMLVFELRDIRNALERVMMHFSHLRKETERTGEDTYRVTLYYDREDETELLIRILGFGPAVKVVSPESFIEKLKDRLKKQYGLFEQNKM